MKWFCGSLDNFKKIKSNQNILLIGTGNCFPKQCTGYFVKLSIKQRKIDVLTKKKRNLLVKFEMRENFRCLIWSLLQCYSYYRYYFFHMLCLLFKNAKWNPAMLMSVLKKSIYNFCRCLIGICRHRFLQKHRFLDSFLEQ